MTETHPLSEGDDAHIVILEDDGSAPPAEASTSAPTSAHATDATDATPLPHPALPETGSRTRRRLVAQPPSTRVHSRVSIADAPLPALDQFNVWEVREADAYLQAGLSPQVTREQGADVLLLGRGNGRLFWVLVGLCALLVVGTFLNVFLTLNMPAKGIPSTQQIGLYRRAEHTKEEIIAFAERVAARMETWKFQTVRTQPKLVVPYLDPSIRGAWEADFTAATSDAASYRERSLFEPVVSQYRGIERETIHIVMVFYQSYHGRGETEGMIKFDAVARRLKLLKIAEGAVSDENPFGLYVVGHTDVPEAALMQGSMFKDKPNPWDQALGIKPKPKKKVKPKTDPAVQQ